MKTLPTLALLLLPLTPLHAQSESIFRLTSTQSGTAVVMHTQGRILYLLTALPLLGDARQPGGPPCTLDHGPKTEAIPCTVLKTYDSVAILRADATDLTGRFPALTLCGSDALTSKSTLKAFSYQQDRLTETPAHYLAPSGFYSYQLTPTLPVGTPILNQNAEIVGITVGPADKQGQTALAIDMLLLALTSDDFFRGQLRRPTPIGDSK